MNVDDLIRAGLHDIAEEVTPYPGLYADAVRRGRRHRAVRRTATASSAVLAVAAIAAGAVQLSGSDGTQTVSPSDSAQQVVTSPWWQTWTPNRLDGGLSQAFLTAARPTYDVNAGPEPITVYAGGTLPDGTQWVMFTDPTNRHVMQWLQGWNDSPDFGESTQKVTPDVSWTSWTIPTRASQDGSPNLQEWLIVVGRPGTTSIEYSPDGTTWQPVDVEHGIGVMKVATPTGFPPATAKVRMSDDSGVYATGTPAGAGANSEPSVSPTPGDGATPTATPTDATATAQRVPPSAPIGQPSTTS